MSDTIDRRVVEMRFDNKDFDNNVQSTLTVLDKLKEKLNFKGAEKAMGASGLGAAVDSVKERFSALEVVGMTALVNLTNSAVNLGKQMAKSLTVDQVKAGFAEYELKMGSIQTIMASTGADIETVNGYLNKLNEYSDKTIYSFSDMTQSIGKFTNAGVDLDTAVKAIQGISNEAAVSGANAQEASRAMYNFAQALSAGYVKLIDWKSIENANMATKEFKQQLIDTAVEMGNLEKNADGTYTVLTKGSQSFKEPISATKNFNDSLSAAWMTTDVLTKTLGQYADETTKIGKKAFAAAQDVKTFSQLLDTVKEAIGSGWAQTFELVFGNLEEAKELWTSVNNVISDFVGKSAEARNGLLQIWHDSPRGRRAMLTGFQNLYKAVTAIVGPIHEAFRDIFPPTTANQLLNFSTRFRALTSHMIISAETAEKIKNVFKVVFSVLKTGITIVSSIAKIFMSLVKALLPLGGSGLSLLDKISQGFISMASAAGTLSDKLRSIAGGVINKAITGLGKLFALLGKGLSSLNLSKVGGLLAGGGIMAVGIKLIKFIDTMADKFENLFGKKEGGGGLMDSVKEALGGLSDTLNQFQTSLKVGQLVTIAIALGILAASCATLANIPAKKLAVAVGAIGGLFTELGIASHLMKGAQTKGIIAMAIAIAILAKAVKTLSEVENMGKGLLGVATLLGELTAFCIVFDRMKLRPKSLKKTAAGLILMAIAINLLAKPVKELGAMDTASLVKGLLALGVMLGEFALTAKAFSSFDNTGMLKAGTSLVLMATAVRLLAKPLAQLGAMDLGSLAKGLSAMGVALLELAGFTKLMSMIAASTGNIMKVSAALLVMSVGIKIMASAITQMGADAGAGQGLAVMFGSLVILAGAMALMQNSLAGAAAMIVVAGALAIMAPAIALLSSLNFGGVAAGMLALAGTLTIFGVASMLLAPVIPIMIALGAAMALLGVGVLSLGAGMTLLVAAFSMATGPIVDGAKALSEAFPIMAEAIGKGIVTVIKTVGESAEAIKEAFIQIVEAIIGVIYEVGPGLVEAGLFLIVKLLEGIDSNIGAITEKAISVIANFINGLASGLPQLVDAGTNLMLSFLNSMADSISANGDKLVAAFENILLAALGAIVGLIPGFGKGAKKAIDEYRKGLDTGKTDVQKSAKSIGDVTAKDLKIKDQTSNGENAVKGLKQGMERMKGQLKATANAIANIVDETIRKKNQIHSPSKRLMETGQYMMEGLIGGIDSLEGEYQKKTNNIATMMISSTSRAASSLSDFISSDPAGFDLSGQVQRAMSVDLNMQKLQDKNAELNNSISQLTKTLGGMTDTMNSRALNNYITIDGSSDPEAFADDLIRSFRLNARTV